MPFLDFIAKNLRSLIKSFKEKIAKSGLNFDEDVFSETMLKCNEKLKGKNLPDEEMASYFWVAFKLNTLRELKYLRNNTTDIIPDSSNEENLPFNEEKFEKVSNIIIKHFGERLYTLFAMHANGMSYNELGKITDVNKLKYQFRKIRDYVRTHY